MVNTQNTQASLDSQGQRPFKATVDAILFKHLVTAFLNELDNDERNDAKIAADKFVAVCVPHVSEDEARTFYWNAYPGFHAFSIYWYSLPAWVRYSNCGPDTREDKSWKRLLAAKGVA